MATYILVDIAIGVGLAKRKTSPTQQAAIYTVWFWIARYGCPIIISSDQGSHFSGQTIQHWSKVADIMCNFHMGYNPTAAGNMERFNGLLKAKVLQLQDIPIKKALEIGCYELNNRPRLNGKPSIEETL